MTQTDTGIRQLVAMIATTEDHQPIARHAIRVTRAGRKLDRDLDDAFANYSGNELADKLAEAVTAHEKAIDDADLRLAAALARAAGDTCACPPCPGRGNDGHGMTHCAECCFGTGVVADLDCPEHGDHAGGEH